MCKVICESACFLFMCCVPSFADSAVFTQSGMLFRKVGAASFDLSFALMNNDVCILFSSSSILPDPNAYEVCIGTNRRPLLLSLASTARRHGVDCDFAVKHV